MSSATLLNDLYDRGLFSSFFASGDFCRLLLTIANSLGLDQDRRSVGFDLDPNCLTL